MLIIAAVLLAIPAPAQDPLGAAYADKPAVAKKVTLTLVSEAVAIAPGQPFRVGIRFDHLKDWHSYWRNSGGFSLPTTIEWQLPDGFTAGNLRWPAPERLVSQGFPAYVMPHHALLLAEITPPTTLAIGTKVTLGVKASGQVCKEACFLFDESASITLPVAGETQIEPGVKTTFDRAAAAMPQPMRGWSAEAGEDATGLGIALTPGPDAATVADAWFFSYTPDLDGQSAQTLTRRDGKLILALQRPQDDTLAKSPRITGVLFTKNGWLTGPEPSQSWEIDIPLGPANPATAATPPPALSLSLVGLALLGGLILNLMPCVFPVLGLKVMNFVNQSGEDHRKVVLHGLVFTAGVVLSFWVLAGLIIALKSASGLASYTWGFQLQDARFVLCMTILLFLFSLSLAGLFEFGTGATGVGGTLARKSGLTGSFFSGVLATLVATPCAAPFLAPALGAALAMPPLASFVLFTSIALGLSLPYLVLAAFPKLVDKLPRPGAWMETFKKVMSFPMFATVAWLLWVLSQQVDTDTFLALLLGLVAMALGAYIFGHWGQPWQAARVKGSARLAAVILIAASTFWAWPSDRPAVAWEKWSPDAVAAAREENRPVFIDFTAAWCATCKANKLRYVHDETVISLMRQKGVLALKADFTNKDTEIARAIAGYGRGAVPVNILYRPGIEEPELLPEIFGAGELVERLSTLPDWKSK